MLVYIIDAFNLIHKIPYLRKSSSPIETLVQYIKTNKLTGSKNNKVIIVIDGRRDVFLKENEYKIVFSDQKSADEVIKNIVEREKNKKIICVVSDDREIISYTKLVGANVLKVDEFVRMKKKEVKRNSEEKKKEINYTLQREITEELKKIWLHSDKSEFNK